MNFTSNELQNLSKLKFIDLWVEFKEYQRLKLKHQSFRKEVNNYETHIVPYFKNYYVIEITAKDYVKFLNHIEINFDFSYSYKKSIHGCMVAILNYAIKFYGLNENIASKVGGFNRKKSRTKKIDFWTIDEYNQFISVVDNEIYKTLFSTLFFTGLRIGECLALTWNDFVNDFLDINKTITKDKNENNEYIINTPKTEHSIRKVKIVKKRGIFSVVKNLFRKLQLIDIKINIVC